MPPLGLNGPSRVGAGEGKGEMRTLDMMWVFLVFPLCQELEGAWPGAVGTVNMEGVGGTVASKANRVH